MKMAIPVYFMDKELEKRIARLEGQIAALVTEIKEINNKLEKHNIK